MERCCKKKQLQNYIICIEICIKIYPYHIYPGWLFDRVIKLAISKFVNSNVRCGPRRKPLYIGLPFLGKSTISLRTSILRICKEFIPTKEIIIFHKPGRRISSFFHIKDATLLDMRSCVIYEYTCAECQSSYIGQTTRHLRHRIAEHAGYRT